jgi:hypothetical protein
MALIDDLLARRATITADLNAMTKLTVGGKPDANTADGGTTVGHIKWRLSLYEELKEINKLIVQEQAIQAAIDGEDGGWEVVTEGYAGGIPGGYFNP